jgi:hypothetical protein
MPAAAGAQGIAPLRLSSGGPPLLARDSLERDHRTTMPLLRTMAARGTVLMECRMPVAVPSLDGSARMPGSHAPPAGAVGTERFGCTNPLGPGANRTAP